MNTLKTSFVAAISLLIALLLTIGCGSSSSTGTTSAGGGGDSNIAAGWTSDSSAYVVADNEDNIASLQDGSVSIKSSAGDSVTIYYNTTTGLPSRAVVGDIVFVFNWDTANSTVDIAFIASDGSIELSRTVSVTSSDISAITNLFASTSVDLDDSVGLESASVKAGLWDDIQEHPWWYIGKAVGVIGCGAAITAAYASAGTSEIVTAGAFMGSTCGMLLVSTAYDASAANEIVDGAAGAPAGDMVLIAVDSAQCASLSLGDCIQAGAGVLDVITTSSDSTETTVETEITTAQASLEGQGGALKFTLSWETAADVDLHVTDPNGERIYWADDTSASGGELDLDDTDGITTGSNPAAENIFWSSSPPTGTYTIEVDYFSGSGSVAYSIVIFVNDVQYGDILTGTLSSADGSSSTRTSVTTYTYSN